LAFASLPASATVLFDLKWRRPPEFAEVKASQAQVRMNSFVWVDVRNPERFESAHIPDAIRFDEANATEGLARIKSVLGAGKKVVVYGEGTGSDRALRVARMIKQELRTKEVALLEGGWASWPRN
jgi:rhodanese-related sulfurtransferase